MGDFSSSDCSWKKMVIAKANNKWISTMKSQESIMNNTVSGTSTSEHEQISVTVVKKEHDENSVDGNHETELPLTITHEIDPLRVQPMSRWRRKSSGGGKDETPEDRALRLAKMSAYAAQRLANETPDQRANRLKRMSEYAAKRLAHETSEQRAKRLSRMSAYAAKRLASETPEQRQARLARMSAYAARRQAMKKGSNSVEITDNSLEAYKQDV